MLAHVITPEQARARIWNAIKARGISRTAAEIGRTPRALHYFAKGGGLSPEAVERLRPILPRIPVAAWLLVQRRDQQQGASA